MQGVAEVVPVSSSAQLALLPWLLDWEPPEDRTTFAAGLHAGSAVGLVSVTARPSWGTAGRLALSSVPAAIAGHRWQDQVERRLGGPRTTAALLAGAGVLMVVADRRPEDRPLTTGTAAAAGLAQVVALAPGVSRSGATYTVLRAMRVERHQAAGFSRLMALPITLGAAGLTLARSRRAPAVVPAALAALAAAGTAAKVPGGSRQVIRGAALYRLGVAACVVAKLPRTGR